MSTAPPDQAASGHVATRPTRSTLAASRSALNALMLRDLVVLRKHSAEFVIRTLVQRPFLLCFVFLFVFPKIGTAVGGGQGGPAAELGIRHRARRRRGGYLDHVPGGAVGRPSDGPGVRLHPGDRGPGAGPLPDLAGRGVQVLSGTVQGLISAAIVLPIASVVHAQGAEAHDLPALAGHPHGGAARRGDQVIPGPVAEHRLEPRNIGLMSASWYSRSPSWSAPTTHGPGWPRSTVGQWHWLQTIVLINPLIYVNEGMRAAFTNAPHMHLYVIYPVLLGFWGVFRWLGHAQLPTPSAVVGVQAAPHPRGPGRPGSSLAR